MIPWTGETMHDGNAMFEAIQRYLRSTRTPPVAAEDRCVNEESPGCAGRAEANGWCTPCWATIVPPVLAPAVTEPFETGCGRR